MRREFLITAFTITGVIIILGIFYSWVFWSFVLIGPLLILGLWDYFPGIFQ